MAEDPVAELFQAFTAYQKTEALRAAVELDVFTAVHAGAATVADLARATGASERGLRMLCDALAAYGYLTKDAGRYAVAAAYEPFLDRNALTYIGSAVRFVASDMLVAAFRDLAQAVRLGGTALPAGGTLAPEHPIWVQFARDIAPLAALTGQLVANVLDVDDAPACKVLDVAAGHGQFGIAIALRNPRAEVVALDWPNVLAVAEENVRKAGVTDRWSKIAGSAFEADLGGGYDLALVTHFFHHFDPSGCEALLRRLFAVLKPGGRVAALEWMPNEDRTTPTESATFSLVMLATTPSGDAYTFPELEAMLRNTGFTDVELCELPPSTQRLVVARRP